MSAVLRHDEGVVLLHVVDVVGEVDLRVAAEHPVGAPACGRRDAEVAPGEAGLPGAQPLLVHHHGLEVDVAGRHVVLHPGPHRAEGLDVLVGAVALPGDDVVRRVVGLGAQPVDHVGRDGQVQDQVVLDVHVLEAEPGREGVRRGGVRVGRHVGLAADARAAVVAAVRSRDVVQLGADATAAVLGAHVDLQEPDLGVVLERAADLGAAHDLVAVPGDPEGAPVVGVGVAQRGRQRRPGPEQGVGPLGALGGLLGLPERAQGDVVGRVDLADPDHPGTLPEPGASRAIDIRHALTHGPRAPEDPARELVEGDRDRRPSRRHGVRRRGRRRPVDRPGQAHLLRHGDQRRGRHRRHRARGEPSRPRGRAGRVVPDRRGRRGRVPRAPRRDRRVRRRRCAARWPR